MSPQVRQDVGLRTVLGATMGGALVYYRPRVALHLVAFVAVLLMVWGPLLLVCFSFLFVGCLVDLAAKPVFLACESNLKGLGIVLKTVVFLSYVYLWWECVKWLLRDYYEFLENIVEQNDASLIEIIVDRLSSIF